MKTILLGVLLAGQITYAGGAEVSGGRLSEASSQVICQATDYSLGNSYDVNMQMRGEVLDIVAIGGNSVLFDGLMALKTTVKGKDALDKSVDLSTFAGVGYADREIQITLTNMDLKRAALKIPAENLVLELNCSENQ